MAIKALGIYICFYVYPLKLPPIFYYKVKGYNFQYNRKKGVNVQLRCIVTQICIYYIYMCGSFSGFKHNNKCILYILLWLL